jgi:hypothetical protein
VIDGAQAFAQWAPDGVFWSQWAKPVVFANARVLVDDAPLAVPDLDRLPLPQAWDATAFVVDLPGAEAVAVGLALAERGFRPVPLFNGTSGPMPVVPVEDIERALGAGVAMLRRLTIAADAKPAFLLDSERGSILGAGEPGRYDNRWVVLPQDLPSAALLLQHGIKDIVLVRQRAYIPEQDLTHVLLRWQQGGLRLSAITVEDAARHENLALAIPSNFRKLWYSVIALTGLRRNNVGGFGDVVPEQTQRSGFYG